VIIDLTLGISYQSGEYGIVLDCAEMNQFG